MWIFQLKKESEGREVVVWKKRREFRKQPRAFEFDEAEKTGLDHVF
jgi:hypothetical protein